MRVEPSSHPGRVADRQRTEDARKWRELEGAPVVLVVHPDGNAVLHVADSVDDEALAAYLEQLAGTVRRGEHRTACAECAAGADHEHLTGVPSSHEPDTDPPAPAASPAPS